MNERATAKTQIEIKRNLRDLFGFDSEPGSAQLFLKDWMPVQHGQHARRQIVLQREGPIFGGELVRLVIEPFAMIDLFHNRMDDRYVLDFAWELSDTVLSDSARPRVTQVLERNGVVEIQFSEPVDIDSANSGISISGSTTTWSALADGYTIRASTTLDPGNHNLSVSTQVEDRSGRSMRFGVRLVSSMKAPPSGIQRKGLISIKDVRFGCHLVVFRGLSGKSAHFQTANLWFGVGV